MLSPLWSPLKRDDDLIGSRITDKGLVEVLSSNGGICVYNAQEAKDMGLYPGRPTVVVNIDMSAWPKLSSQAKEDFAKEIKRLQADGAKVQVEVSSKEKALESELAGAKVKLALAYDELVQERIAHYKLGVQDGENELAYHKDMLNKAVRGLAETRDRLVKAEELGYARGRAEAEALAQKEHNMSEHKDTIIKIFDIVETRVASWDKLEALINEIKDGAYSDGFNEGYDQGSELDVDLDEQDEEDDMTTTPTVTDILLDEGSDALNRMAGKQILKLTREPIIAYLAGHLGKDDPSMRAKVADFINTEMGEALVALLISLGLSTMPKGFIPQQAAGLARELRTVAMTNAGDVAADLLMAPLRAVICGVLTPNVLAGLPAETQQVRVSIPQPQQVPEPALAR
jgi:hypothetical protein